MFIFAFQIFYGHDKTIDWLRYETKIPKFEKSDSKLDTVTEEIWIDYNFKRFKTSVGLEIHDGQYKAEYRWQ